MNYRHRVPCEVSRADCPVKQLVCADCRATVCIALVTLGGVGLWVMLLVAVLR